jgi:hypothetical protein
MAKKDKAAPAADGAATAEAPAKAEVVKQPSANGVTRPRDGTATGRVWAITDELSKAAGSLVGRADVMKAGEAEGLNPATIATQYGRYRKFYGIKAEPRAAKAEAGAPSEGTAAVEE